MRIVQPKPPVQLKKQVQQMKKEGVKKGEDQPLEQSWPIKEGRDRPQRMGVKRSDAEGGSEMDTV